MWVGDGGRATVAAELGKVQGRRSRREERERLVRLELGTNWIDLEWIDPFKLYASAVRSDALKKTISLYW